MFRELTRVKEYFDKIKMAEFGESKRDNMSLNKPAVMRFLKHDLVDITYSTLGWVQADFMAGR